MNQNANEPPAFRYQHLVRQDCPLPPGAHVVGYCRDSGGEEQDRSITQQIEAMREYCQRFGLVLEHIYSDEAERATAIERRDEFSAMMDDLSRRFSVVYDQARREKRTREAPFGVICWKSSRLGRNLLHTRHVKSDLRLRGITIINLISSFETGNAGLDALVEAFVEFQDEQLLKDISDNARRGLAQLVTLRDNDPEFLAHNPDWQSSGAYLGILPGGVPTGFRAERIVVGVYKRKNGKRSGQLREVQRIIPDPDTWERCRLAWQLRHDGATIQEVMDATRLFNSVASYASFFANLIYTGVLEYGGHRIEGFVPALIPMDWWLAEQARRNERGKKRRGSKVSPLLEPRRVGGRHLLSGLLFCGAVDGVEHPMQADVIPAKKDVRGHWDFYICGVKKNSRGHQCTSKRIGARGIEQSVIDVLMRDILTRETIAPLAEAIAVHLAATNNAAATELDATEEAFTQVERQIANLIHAVEEVGLSPSLKQKLTEREAEREYLKSRIAMLRAVAGSIGNVLSVSESLLDEWLIHIRLALQGSDKEAARRALRQFVRKIVLKDSEGEIHFTLPNLSPVESRLGEHNVDLRGNPSFPSHVRCFPLVKAGLPARQHKQGERYERVLALRGEGMSYRQIGRRLNIHWTRVQQILKQPPI